MKRILVQLDTDAHPSVFDRVVAVDADVEFLFSYGEVAPENVTPLVHGTIFTRGVPDLKNTAIFVGGSDVTQGEAVFARVLKTFFGPMRVSVMMDSNGSNTTAAAAVLAARRHISLKNCEALVLPGTGPVGLRAAQLLAAEGANVKLASRSLEKAQHAADAVKRMNVDADVSACASGSNEQLLEACQKVQVLIAAGAAGVELVGGELWSNLKSTLKVAIDLNAVPPLGIAPIKVTDKAADHDGVICYGAIGVGGLKMKIHKAALKRLFEANDLVLDTQAIYDIGQPLA